MNKFEDFMLMIFMSVVLGILFSAIGELLGGESLQYWYWWALGSFIIILFIKWLDS